MNKLFPNRNLRWILLGLLFTYSSCELYELDYITSLDKLEDYYYKANFAVPLVNSALKVQDIIEPDTIDLVEVDEDNLIWIVYSSGNAYTKTAGEVYSIEDQSSDFSLQISPSLIKSQQTIDQTFPFVYEGEERVDSIRFLNATLIVEVESQQLQEDGYDLEVSFAIPDSYDENGDPLQNTFLLTEQLTEVDLSGYTIVFQNEGGANFFDVQYLLTLTGNGTPSQAEYTVNFLQKVQNIEFDVIYGYIGTFEFELGNGDLEINLFEDVQFGGVYFKNPMIDMFVTNFFGLEIDMDVVADFLINDGAETLELEIYEPGLDPWRLQSPAFLGDSVVNTEQFNRSNTNVFDAIASLPEEFSYLITCMANPDQNPDKENFVSHDSKLNFELEFNMPMDMRVEEIDLQSTFDFSFGEDLASENLDSVKLKVLIENDFPLQGLMEIYFLDESGDTLAALFDQPELQPLFESAPAEDQFSTTTTEIKLTSDKIEKLFQAKSFGIHSKLSTRDSTDPDSYVKFYDDHQIRVKIGAIISANTLLEYDPI
ncbi:MAG: hypothetical protein ACLFQS_03900 [Bacteroidales bacterium]